MDYEDAKRQGKRNGGKKTLEEMAEEFGESWKTFFIFKITYQCHESPKNDAKIGA